MIYFAMGYDGHLYNLSDCGDYESADESATDLGIDTCWIFDENVAREWVKGLATWLSIDTDTG